MKIALIADIHGNAHGLETVLGEIERLGADEILCLGDVAVLGPQPREVVGRLRDLGCAVVRGNTDAWLLDEPSDAEPASAGPVAELLAWTREQLDATDIATIRGYVPYHRASLGDGIELLCAHGSPRSFEDVIGPSTAVDEVGEMFAGFDVAFAAGGHTHVQLFRRFGRLGFVNPGSAGLPGAGPNTPDLPVNRDVAWTEFAMVEQDGDRMSVDLRRVSVDVGAMIERAEGSGMPHVEWWRARWSPS